MFGDDIVEALGLTARRVRKLTIACEANCMTTVEAEMVLDLDESGEEFLTELRRYELVERTDEVT